MYSYDQVLIELDNSIALKTLKNWANKIEKLTDTKFIRKYAKNSKGRTYSYKVFNISDIENFKRLIELRRDKVPLDLAIRDIFMSEEEKKNQETISIAKKDFEENQSTVKELIELVRSVLSDNADIKKRLKKLETKKE